MVNQDCKSSAQPCIHLWRTLLMVVVSLFIHACGGGGILPRVSLPNPDQDRGPRPGSVDVSSIPDAVPRDEPRSKYGNPPSYVVNGKTYHVMNSSEGFSERGIASWYGEKFHGRRTSSGETYDMYGMTAAHNSLPLPTYAEVTNLQTGKRIVVKVNDRGPFHDNRVIDLSYSAASKLGILGKGTGVVEVRVIDTSYVAATSTENTQLKTTPATSPLQAPVRTVAIPVTVPVSRVSSVGFYIQVGAFSQLANAQKMYDKLGALANNLTNISEAEVNGSRVYRVRIGPIDDVSVADRVVSELGSLGISEHQITTD